MILGPLTVVVMLGGSTLSTGLHLPSPSDTPPLPEAGSSPADAPGVGLEGSTREEDPFEGRSLELVREPPSVPPASTPRPGHAAHPYTRRARASFRIRVQNLAVPYRVIAVPVRPGEAVHLELDEIPASLDPDGFRLRGPDGLVAPEAPGEWRWTAPEEPGAVPLRLESTGDGDAIHLNVLVLHPFEEAEGGALKGFRIGDYRLGEPPEGFVEAAEELLDLRVSPGFTLGQFLPHQPGTPRYLAVSMPLLLKLEAILEEVRAEGIGAETLFVMSSFRTPHYNRAIGNTTDASRHLWGDAADVFIDESGDGRMDDLTGDGRGGEADARLLYRIVERVEARGEPHVLPGGLSLYPANDVRGPFLHVDARGHAARW